MTKMWLAVGVLLTLCVAAPSVADAQYCIGYTEYGIRGPDGKALSKKDLRSLRFERFDGKKRKIEFKRGEARVSYEVGREVRRHRISGKDGVRVTFGPCGQIDELVLSYRGVVMELSFKVDINNTNFVIDSLPFQAGRFQLKSLKCKSGKAAPMIDNERSGHCAVPASAWKRVPPRRKSKTRARP